MTKGEGLNPATAGGNFPSYLCPQPEHCHQTHFLDEQRGKLRLSEEEGLLRDQHGVGGRAESRSRSPDTHTSSLPCQVLVLQQTLSCKLWWACQGYMCGSPHTAVGGSHHAQSPGLPVPLTCGPFKRPGAELSSQNSNRDPWLGLFRDLQVVAGTLGKALDFVPLWSRALFCLTSLQQSAFHLARSPGEVEIQPGGGSWAKGCKAQV